VLYFGWAHVNGLSLVTPPPFSLILVEPLKFKKDISHFKPLISHIGIDIYIPLLYIYTLCAHGFLLYNMFTPPGGLFLFLVCRGDKIN